MTCSGSYMFGGYQYSKKRKSKYGRSRYGRGTKSRTRRRSKITKYNNMSRSRSRSIGLSLARDRTYSGGSNSISGVPTGYSTGGLLNPMLSSLANPPIIKPYNSCL
jgi:hypothetical protein